MKTEEWKALCKERGRRGGLVSAHKKRTRKMEETLKQEANTDTQCFNYTFCPECGTVTHLGHCEQCSGEWEP